MDENGNPIVALEDDGGDDDGAVYAESLVDLQKCYTCWSCCLHSMLGTKKRSSIFFENKKEKRKSFGSH